MSIFAAAEFDSVDLADLATGRIRGIQGVKDAEVLRNRFAAQMDDEDKATPTFIPAGAGWSYSSAMGVGPFYSIPFSRGFDDESGNNFEPARRRDTLLKVEVSDEDTARKVCSVLRSIGGRSVSIVKK